MEFSDRELLVMRAALEHYARCGRDDSPMGESWERSETLRDREIAQDLALRFLGVRGRQR